MTAPKQASTPNTVTPALREFCAFISPSEPVFVTSIAGPRAATSFCSENVARRVRATSGSIAYGWAIWHMPGLYFEAEPHAGWRNKLGNLIDVSPQMGGQKRLLFLPDDGAVYDAFAIRPNIMVPDGNSERARLMTELGNCRHALLLRCRIPGAAEIRRYEPDQVELADIDRQIQQIILN